MAQVNKIKQEPAVILFCNSASGIYIPQRFAAEIMPQYLQGVTQEQLNELADPDSEWYWDTWETVLNNAKVVDGENTYILHQSEHGDLWLLDRDRMTEEEKDNFGFND